MARRPIDPVLPGGNLSELHVGMMFQTVVAGAIGRREGRPIVDDAAVAAVAANGGAMGRYYTGARATNQGVVDQVGEFIVVSGAGERRVLVLNRVDSDEATLDAAVLAERAHENRVTHWTVLCLEKNADGSLAISYADSVRPGTPGAGVIPPQVAAAVNRAATGLGVGVGFRPFPSVMQTGANCGYYAVWNAMRMLGFGQHVEADPEHFVARQRVALTRGAADGGLPGMVPPPQPAPVPPPGPGSRPAAFPPPRPIPTVPPRTTVAPSAAGKSSAGVPPVPVPSAIPPAAPAAATKTPASIPVALPASVAAKKTPVKKRKTLDGPLKTRISRVRELYAEYRVKDLNLGANYERIYRELVDADERDFGELYSSFEEIFAERQIRLKQDKNVDRQQKEIRVAELINSQKPGTYRVREFLEQHESMIPLRGEGPAWEEGKQGYHRATEGDYESMINNSLPRVLTTLPSISYRNMVFDGRARTLDELKVNDEKIRIRLEKGREATPEELEKVRKFSPLLHTVSNAAETVAGAATQVINTLGRGLIATSSVSKDRRYLEYKARERNALSMLAHRLAPSQEVFEKMMQRLDEFGDADDELFNQTTMSRMSNLVLELAKESGKFSEAQMKEAEKAFQERDKQYYAGIQKFVDWEDKAMMWRYLHIFLILTPIGGLTPIFSEFFNWTDVLKDLFGPVFDASKGFFQGLADVATNSSLGPFGKMADVLGVDEIIMFAGDLPIVSSVGDIFDLLMDNSITTNIFSALSPLLGSPLVPLYVAGVYSLIRFEKEFSHHLEVKEFTDQQNKALEVLSETITKRMDGSGMAEKVKAFVKEKEKITKEARLQVSCARFLAEADPAMLRFFDEFEFNTAAGGIAEKSTLSRLAETGAPLEDRQVLDLMLKHPKCAEIIDKFSMLHSCGYDTAAVPADAAARTKLSEQGKAMINREFVEQKAAEFNFRPYGKSDAEKFASLEEQLRKQEVDQMMEVIAMNIRSVDKVATPAAAASTSAASTAAVPAAAPAATPAVPAKITPEQAKIRMNPPRYPGRSPCNPSGQRAAFSRSSPAISVGGGA